MPPATCSGRLPRASSRGSTGRGMRCNGGSLNRCSSDPASLIAEGAKRLPPMVLSQSGLLVRNVASFVLNLVVTLFATFFLLRDSEPDHASHPPAAADGRVVARDDLNRTRELISVGVVSAGVVAIVQGFLGGVIFAILGIDAAIFWGVVMGICCLLPFGAWLIWLPAAIVLAAEGSDRPRRITLAVLGFGVVSSADNFLRPILLERESPHEWARDFHQPARRHQHLRYAGRRAGSGARGDRTGTAHRLRQIRGRRLDERLSRSNNRRAANPRAFREARRISRAIGRRCRFRRAPGRRDDRSHDRCGVLGQPAPRRRLRSEDLARPPLARPEPRIRLRFERPLPLNPAVLDTRRAGRRAPRDPSRRLARREGHAAGVGHGRERFRCFPSCSKSPLRDFWSSSITATRAASSSTSPCLEGDDVKIVDEQASRLPECPSLLTSLLGFDNRETSILVQLAVSIRAHGRGGSLLVVPSGTDSWRESIVQPISCTGDADVCELAELVEHEPSEADDREHRLWQEAVTDAVDAIAGLTAVDGATIITDRYELLAFGAKIARREGSPSVEDVIVTEPVEGGAKAVVHATRLGGTRHLSAAQFVHDQRGGVALVASVDGRFTIFAWTSCENTVHAHRVEALLPVKGFHSCFRSSVAKMAL